MDQISDDRSKSACIRCRRQRLKCDNRQVKCLNCEIMGVNCETVHPLTRKFVPRNYIQKLEHSVRIAERKLMYGEITSLVTSNEGNLSLWGNSSGLHIARYISSMLSSKALSQHYDFFLGLNKTYSPPIHGGFGMMRLPSKSSAEEMLVHYLDTIYPCMPFVRYEVVIEFFYEPIYGSPGPLLTSKYPEFFYLRRERNKFRSESLQPEYLSHPIEKHLRRPMFFLLLIFAVVTAQDNERSQESYEYQSQARIYFSEVFNTADLLASLSSFLILGLYSLRKLIFPGTWQLNGLISGMCIEQGLHLMNDSFDSSEPSVARADKYRVFVCCIMFDKHVSAVLGRPSLMHEIEIRDRNFFDFLDLSTERQKSYDQNLTVQLASDKSTRHLFEILCIQDEIKFFLYDRPVTRRLQTDIFTRTRHQLASRLNACYRSYREDCIKLNAFYLSSVSVIYFNSTLLLTGFSKHLPSPDVSELGVILDASEGMVGEYFLAYTQKTSSLVWAAVSHLTFAASAGIYALWRLKSVAQLELNHIEKFKTILRDSITLVTAFQSSFPAARDCLELFELLRILLMRLTTSGAGLSAI